MNNSAPLSDVLITYRLYLEPGTPENVDVAHTTLRHIVANMNNGRARLLQSAAERTLELTNGSTVGFSFEDKRSDDSAMVWAASAGVNAEQLTGEVPQHHSPCSLARLGRRAQLFAAPSRHYGWIEALGPVSELLVMPVLDRYGHACGALWVFVQDGSVKLRRKEVLHLQSLLEYMMEAMEVQRGSPMP